MNKKRILVVVFLAVFLVLNLFNLIMIYKHNSLVDFITGNLLANTGVFRFLLIEDIDFEIHSPIDNQTYDFELSEAIFVSGIPHFMIDLNVSSEDEIDEWKYSLYHEEYGAYSVDIEFSPNQTIASRMGWNNLTVSVSKGITSLEKYVYFYINVSSAAPIINITDGSVLYACEGEAYNYPFDITYYEDLLELLELSIFPEGAPFYVSRKNEIIRILPGIFWATINSRTIPLAKSRVGNHSRQLRVTDGFYSDTKDVILSVLEVNRIPVVEEIGSILVWNIGDKNTSFSKTWFVDDVEDGDSYSGNLYFNLSYVNGSEFDLFDIDNYGLMNFSADENTSLGIRYLRVCVTDNPIPDPHPNLTYYCDVDGGANTVCRNFYFTVTDENRPPEIIEHYPLNESFSIKGETTFTVNATAYDPDINPIDYEWFINDFLITQKSFNWSEDYYYFDEFSYSFPCGVYGNQSLTVRVSDGLEAENHTWIIYVDGVPCPQDIPPTRVGAAGPAFCLENWVCFQWQECRSLKDVYGEISLFNYTSFNDICNQMGYLDNNCGFQLRECIDLNECNNTHFRVTKPTPLEKICYYVPGPSCYDGIMNCHSGDCELGIDCGGPCSPCPSCFDGIKNQGEQGIDCGGPCPWPCEIEEPFKINYFVMVLLVLIILLGLFIIFFGYRILSFIFGWKRNKESYEKKFFFTKDKSRKKRVKNLLSNLKRGEKKEW